MYNQIKLGEFVSMSSLFLKGKTHAGHRVDGVLWQDEQSGLWQFQNGNDLGLIDYGEDSAPLRIRRSIELPHGNVVAIVDAGNGCNAVTDGMTFDEVYRTMCEWDAACPQRKEVK